MKISDLYDRFAGQDAYIVGTGPSMSVFDRSILSGKFCIVLNQGCGMFPELGPVGFVNHKKFLRGGRQEFRCVKGRHKFSPNPERDDNHVRWNDPEHYVFSYREPPWDTVSHHDESTLFAESCYYWSPPKGSISAFAMQFALWCNVRSITLVGCDSCEIDGTHYVDGHKNTSIHIYRQYVYGLERMRTEAMKRGVPVYSLTPFVGLGHHERQFKEWSRDK